MPRILGVDIPNDRKTVVSLTYLYGVGDKTARELCQKAGIDPEKRARELAEDELGRLAALLERDYVVEGPLRRVLGTVVVLEVRPVGDDHATGLVSGRARGQRRFRYFRRGRR